MTSPTLPLIAIDDISYTPGGVPVLRGVSLQSDAARIGIVGRNGSGKTSFARVLSGLVAADQGQVRISGIDVAHDRRRAIGAVGILFQNPDHQIIFPTVEEEIAFGLLQMGQTKAQAARGAAAILGQFNKRHWAQASIHQLSQGQRQLVCLMAVLAMQPRVLVLDEPFAGLDIPTRLHLERVLAGLDLTLVHITHDPAAVAGYEHILWLEGGEVAQQGSARPVLRAFETRMKELGASDDLSDLAG
ncbi:Biotin transport ATP-binding protein BioM [Sulfitobacter sp. DSM 110093]|uniref:energy-coupling factor ABC transporter ATP-binding protein n=1 Tax=Sulfitobacter sp. DSM 110093 TaxID=2883127 RepID=UPI001FAD7293|nr:ABC transporter ATP-binding protein [Sulfitobacter sp. DSM 110093]UOA33354.1 Biotin transport ATP-binding protein BioM [Sulfitobacter sp. DSM 110093]